MTSYKEDFRKSGRSAHSLSNLIHDYLEEVEISGKAAITAQRYAAYLQTFVDWAAASTRKDALALADVDAELLRQYRLYLARRRDPRSGRPIGPATRNLYQIALRNFLRYCRRRQLEAPDPDQTLVLAKERDVEIRHLTKDEVGRLARSIALDEPNGLRNRAIVEVLFGTGCRVSELVALTIRQVDLARREAEVIGKGGRSRLVLLTEDAAGWLRRYLDAREDDSPHLFVSRRRTADGTFKPLSTRQIDSIVERAARRAGLPFRVSPHWFRHTRLSILTRHSGVQVAQRIAGHASIATTSRYLHVSDVHLRRAFDEAERAERGDSG